MSVFHPLHRQLNSYYITEGIPFVPFRTIDADLVEVVFNFAYDMSFGNCGEHRDHRSGGQHHRRNGEIFANAFQGKLAECAVYLLFKDKFRISEPDFATYELGEWDKADFYLEDYKISVKSTKSIGNLLLLETKDWDANGVYLPNDETYDFTFLVRMNPFCADIMKKNKMYYSDSVPRDILRRIICNEDWKFDIPGFITLSELQTIIRDGFILPQNSMLNGGTKMDAENFYVQAGDMHNINDFEEYV